MSPDQSGLPYISADRSGTFTYSLRNACITSILGPPPPEGELPSGLAPSPRASPASPPLTFTTSAHIDLGPRRRSFITPPNVTGSVRIALYIGGSLWNFNLFAAQCLNRVDPRRPAR